VLRRIFREPNLDVVPGGGIQLTRVRNNSFRDTRETVVQDDEFDKALAQADAISSEYSRLRALAAFTLMRRKK
jgi:hypothetical protein